MMRIAFGLVYFGFCLATIKSQFIEISHEAIRVGDDVTLKCSLGDEARESQDVTSYVWYFNNKKVINGEHFFHRGNELLITNAVKHLTGYYSCVVEFLYSGAKLETPHELINIVDKHDQLDKQPDSPCSFRIPKLCRNKRNKNEDDVVPLNAKEGSSATLDCQLEKVEDENSVKWLKDGGEVALVSNSTQKSRYDVDATDYSLTIAEVALDDGGIYDCAMFNTRSKEFVIKAKQRYQLAVHARLKFTTKPLPTKNMDLGLSSKVHCKAAGSTRVYWVREPDEALPDDVEDLNGTLVFNNVRLEHKGNYTCIASTDEESIKTSVEVQILPKFDIAPPKNLEVVELQPVFLDCVASGSPTPTIKWDHETTIINDGDDGRFRIFDNGTLLLHEARQDDAGIYGCFIGSSAGFKRAETVLIVKSMDSHSSFEDANQENGFIMSKAVLMTCLVALIYISLVVALMLWCRHKRQKSRASEDPENKDRENDDTASDGDDGDEKEPLNHEPKTSRTNKVHQHTEKQRKLATSPSSTLIIDHLMIRHDCLIDLTKIGRGEFGEVLSGAVLESDVPAHKNPVVNGSDVNEIQAQQRVSVLVKSLSKIKDESFFVEFRRQIDLYRAVDSQNVVRLLALCFEKDHHFMVLEQGQDLKGYLSEHPDTPIQTLFKFSRQIACGLDAIAKSKLTHRDIALRNCIITNSIVKLSSISLCKDRHANEYFKLNNKMIPLRHLAPEILQSASFSTASDVYACGVTVWEVLNLGQLPFETTINEEFFQLLQSKSIDYGQLFGNDKVPKELQETLLKCWATAPNERPTPDTIVKSLDALLTVENGDTH